MRDVTVDEIFEWKDEFGFKAKETFGSHCCDASPKTFSDMKARCDVIASREIDILRVRHEPPLNGIMIHMVPGIPDGFIVPCRCKETKRSTEEAK